MCDFFVSVFSSAHRCLAMPEKTNAASKWDCIRALLVKWIVFTNRFNGAKTVVRIKMRNVQGG